MKIKPVVLLATALCLGIINLFGQSTQNASPPNVVLIFLDDLGYGDLSSTGNLEISTPNIDRIGEEGIVFSQAYSASPYCSPSRAAGTLSCSNRYKYSFISLSKTRSAIF